jgi:hypothetical protein
MKFSSFFLTILPFAAIAVAGPPYEPPVVEDAYITTIAPMAKIGTVAAEHCVPSLATGLKCRVVGGQRHSDPQALHLSSEGYHLVSCQYHFRYVISSPQVTFRGGKITNAVYLLGLLFRNRCWYKSKLTGMFFPCDKVKGLIGPSNHRSLSGLFAGSEKMQFKVDRGNTRLKECMKLHRLQPNFRLNHVSEPLTAHLIVVPRCMLGISLKEDKKITKSVAPGKCREVGRTGHVMKIRFPKQKHYLHFCEFYEDLDCGLKSKIAWYKANWEEHRFGVVPPELRGKLRGMICY